MPTATRTPHATLGFTPAILAMVGLTVAAVTVCLTPQADAYVQVTVPVNKLPEDKPYQKTLRDYFTTLTPADFEVPPGQIAVVPTDDVDEQFRFWLLTRQNMVHLDAARLPAEAFTLKAIESQQSLSLPAAPMVAQSLAWLAQWDYPGNPFKGDAALKRRAIVLAAVDMIMLDHLYDTNPQGAARPDYLGGNLIWIGYAFHHAADVMPPKPRAAFEAGVRRMVERMTGWGPSGAMTDMDLFAGVAMAYIQQGTQDPELQAMCKAYARRLFTEDRFFHPAGYFVDNNCFDTSYNGISLYFAVWADLLTDWDFADEAVEQAHRLRGYLCFPDLGGGFAGPSHISSRTSADPANDQWRFQQRIQGAAFATDHALWDLAPPTEQQLAGAAERAVAGMNQQLAATPEPANAIWREAHWSRIIQLAYENYPRGFYQRWRKLLDADAPITRPPFLRDGDFTERFENAFIIAKRTGDNGATFGAALHAGLIGRPFGHNNLPYGFGGGQLATFWTPETGPILNGRRRGVQGAVIDQWSEWRLWPNHAVTGVTSDGLIATSSRIRQPQPGLRDQGALGPGMTVSAPLPSFNVERRSEHDTGWVYDRRIDVAADAVHVQTNIRAGQADARASFSELYETLPVFVYLRANHPHASIHFHVNGQWTTPEPGDQATLTRIRLTRGQGAVEIEFDQPRTVSLAPSRWTDGYQSQAACHNILIHMAPTADRPAINRYAIRPVQAEGQP